VGPAVVDGVARDFDLGDNTTSGTLTAQSLMEQSAITQSATAQSTPSNGGSEKDKFDLVDALRSLATLADRLREEEKDLPDERKL